MADVTSPTGFGEAKFGASVAEVKKIYPDMRELSASENLGAVPVGGPYITRYVVRQQKIEGLEKPADVEFRFWKGKFWLFVVYLGENDLQSALELLADRYGPVTNKDPRFPIWNWPTTTILVEPKEKRYTINYEELSKEARTWFVEMLKSGRASPAELGPSPTAAASPGASPRPPAPTSAPSTDQKP
jgi:hypothetical protein